jgi:hypothetical protein
MAPKRSKSKKMAVVMKNPFPQDPFFPPSEAAVGRKFDGMVNFLSPESNEFGPTRAARATEFDGLVHWM